MNQTQGAGCEGQQVADKEAAMDRSNACNCIRPGCLRSDESCDRNADPELHLSHSRWTNMGDLHAGRALKSRSLDKTSKSDRCYFILIYALQQKSEERADKPALSEVCCAGIMCCAHAQKSAW